MSGFQLLVHLNGEEHSVNVEPRASGYVVIGEGGSTLARNLRQATKAAAEIVGPILERTRSTGAAWGLYVKVGDAAARFGTWPPTVGPQVNAPINQPPSHVSRIWDHWANRDGTPLGALDAAIKIIDHYSARPRGREAA